MRNRIVEMNLRLVVAIAKTRVKAGYDLSECVSDGNLALIQAVDGFDFARGNRFSTMCVLGDPEPFSAEAGDFDPSPRSLRPLGTESPSSAGLKR